MPCLVASFDPAIGPILGVIITAAGSIQSLAQPVGTTIPQSVFTPVTPIPLLVDTGADVTCISPQIARQLNLTPIGLRPVGGATAVPGLRNKYLVDIGIPFAGPPMPGGGITPALTLVVPNIEVIEFIGGNPHFQGLLGRDILMNAHLSISCFARTFTFCM